MQKLGINLESVSSLAHEDFFKIIKELGFGATFTDMSFGDYVPEIAELCAKHNIEYSFVHAPFAGTNNIWLDCDEGEKLYEDILHCINLCGESGVPTAVVHISSGYTPPPLSELGQTRFKKIVERAHNKNVNIAFENLRIPEYLHWAMDTFKDNSNVGFCWDIGHENCFTEGLEYMSLYGDKLLCTHIHDNLCERGRDLHLLPFDGKIDYKSAMKHIKNCSYTGSLMLEVFKENKFSDVNIYKDITDKDFLEKAYAAILKIQSFTTD